MSPKRAHSEGAASAMPGAVWFREPRPAGRAQALTRERIVAAAVALLDEHGVAGLSMRKLAEVLNVHATSLYWHVPHRDDLLDLALDAVFADVALPARHSAEWRADVAAFMDEWRAALLRHPWSGPLAGSRPLLGPNALARSEFVFAALVSGGFTGDDLTAAAGAVSNYVIGTVAAEVPWKVASRADEEGARSALISRLRGAAETHPTLAAHPPALRADWDRHYARGRDFLLDGLAAARPRS
ncbi:MULTISPECIES: TetR/AcrR family transcriptional regulator C-terminal domain-containing protein [unclassified Streptomyces]|uniref:TetR/AcrR family transcriptional regulator C-terminal domain-containing protein n=1 Tax=unclassified Streptomyces TaxID=2593676 RepID=UPI002DDC46F9|nr:MULTISPECIES: TetR/AcrR family transcriptional regulator C-terminal domain-containing protein [unclassified Streptomyces]WSA93550.1 TetR/AcrR family transcriptional regulator C-terminal domain-containing protein [Streptomyces sp. NBC_01795]WSB77920.1 TetR/AcrR family transcriptional regulator C-terminal domain-containing protein [Streptomyces sp. NBC_01775]WSS42648.1 TetR/AcrR family transcriptional regulator C-terminal domain-containing protein [Streptomyces sp. NBC_01187]